MPIYTHEHSAGDNYTPPNESPCCPGCGAQLTQDNSYDSAYFYCSDCDTYFKPYEVHQS